MKRVLAAIFFESAFAGSASAGEQAAPSCLSSFWNYLNSSARDCPLQFGPLTLIGNIDGGFGYEQWGAPIGPYADKPNYAIVRNSANSHWLRAPNGASTSVIGVTLNQKIFGEWSLIGVAEAGFNPYSFRLINGPQSLADNNFYAVPYQRTAFDSSRAGQWDNSQGFIGLSHPTFGTLTYGRTNTLTTSAFGAYDPVASVAFSQLGFSALYSGFGASPTARVNTALTYRLTYRRVHLAAQTQIGGYGGGNAATNQSQIQLGARFGNLSLDAIAGYARNAVMLSSFSGAPLPPGYDPNAIVRATLADTAGMALLARYDWKPFKFYMGYVHSRTGNPTDGAPFGLSTIAEGIVVPPSAVTSNAFEVSRLLNTVWTGVRYAATKDVDLAAGAYWESQNDYLAAPATCTGSGTATSSGRCAGGRYSYSFRVNYRPVDRVTLYAGVLVSNVYGGVASGFQHSQNIAPTAGARLTF
ncbi:porin [Rhodoblastus acidophilus]|uniref:Porin n=1 Tax=Candidatus Rhodoblastus alkanivorans TaxID=2954117 RepID=A0ABS9Z9E9_9HYPH|nr:porin [Candidatus Rhodoblastus alkanivorans]MCI4679650.1 porin [Candidatus Rhodoblastus alkanivorans]MCI4683686.1 porin [Candidatus Rhodoblastus alkanivorans]MDI4641003.1 porin [Rhodoblastus acidophilus]